MPEHNSIGDILPVISSEESEMSFREYGRGIAKEKRDYKKGKAKKQIAFDGKLCKRHSIERRPIQNQKKEQI